MFPRSPALNTIRNPEEGQWHKNIFCGSTPTSNGLLVQKWAVKMENGRETIPVCTVQVLTIEIKADRPLTEIVSIEGHIEKIYSSQNKGNFFCFKLP